MFSVVSVCLFIGELHADPAATLTCPTCLPMIPLPHEPVQTYSLGTPSKPLSIGKRAVGSRMKLFLVSTISRAISYPPRHPGIENVICWVFADLRYKVLNPCEVLKIYHIHCGVRLKLGPRINNRHSHSAFPGNQLF